MKAIKPENMRYLLCDDKSHSFFFARRRGDEIRSCYYDMKIGQFRRIEGTSFWIVRMADASGARQ